MKTRIIRIGNSRGVRIPKVLLDQANLNGDVDMTVRNGGLVIMPSAKPRAGWSAGFREMAKGGDDTMLDDVTASSWDEAQWEWR